ncbi:MAG: oxygen-independent coproporphyrinogen III oxidase [Rhizobiales bacterium]|nr:oxygen-independent coproporphyrinogen III oxidase [Hyphomicrobiales bacterium]
MQHALIEKHAKPAPRYTSYPTAPHFHEGVDRAAYRRWLASINASQSLSLYVHIPYCDTLCWFCGCNTKYTRKYWPVADYLPVVKTEISKVAAHLAETAGVQTIHWGGGSPTILTPDDTLDLATHIRDRFDVAPSAGFSIEIDPRGMGADKIEALATAGVTRASIGVQDFDAGVQMIINRRQSFEETKDVIFELRRVGIEKINIDLIYGLPGQTISSVAATVAKVQELMPSRIALFGYAHVPWMKTHQRMLDEAMLPDAHARFEQSRIMADLLCAGGYELIGMDHFALPDDPLSQARRAGRLRRNFQGYTDDPADVLLGFGASAIGKLREGYVHNATPTAEYKKLIADHGLAVVNGYALKPDDELRAYVIERLICDFAISRQLARAQFGAAADEIFLIAGGIARDDEDGLVDWDDDVFRITKRGEPFVRSICSQFDGYLERGNVRHSMAV